MSTTKLNAEQLRAAVAEAFVIGDNNIPSITGDIFKEHVLDVVGVTPEAYAEIESRSDMLMAAVTHVGGEKCHEVFKENADLQELSWSYQQGSQSTVTGIHRNSAENHTLVVNNRSHHADCGLNEAYAFLNDLYANVNS